jgi:hypothetical protein
MHSRVMVIKRMAYRRWRCDLFVPQSRTRVSMQHAMNPFSFGRPSNAGGGTTVRLAAALGASERLWMCLQADFDLEEAHRIFGNAVEQIERIAT